MKTSSYFVNQSPGAVYISLIVNVDLITSSPGGYDGVQYLCVVEVYDSESNCWRKLAPLTTGRAGAAVVAVPPPRAMF